jgi:hypothetical protein
MGRAIYWHRFFLGEKRKKPYTIGLKKVACGGEKCPCMSTVVLLAIMRWKPFKVFAIFL